MRRVDTCQSCGGAELVGVLARRGVPVENSRLSRTEETAAAVPQGDLRIERCSRCGFVQNSEFDATLVSYDSDYEDSQGHSAYFLAYAERIIAELIERFGLEGARALEIGCGRGDFLDMFCARSGGTGIGLDPAAGRGVGRRGMVEIRGELFGTGSGHHHADLVLCRHTLEHIPDVHRFLQMLRAEFDGRPEAILYLEVPDASRIAREGAFWDIYFEHCSYFDVAALTDLLCRTGFEPIDVRLEYGDQYLVAYARLGDLSFDSQGRPEPASFSSLSDNVEAWRRWGLDQSAAGATVAVWAASSKAVGLLSFVPEIVPSVAVDVNPAKAGRFLPASGVPICRPDELHRYRPDTILVMNPLYGVEIATMLDDLGIDADLWAMGPQPTRLSR